MRPKTLAPLPPTNGWMGMGRRRRDGRHLHGAREPAAGHLRRVRPQRPRISDHGGCRWIHRQPAMRAARSATWEAPQHPPAVGPWKRNHQQPPGGSPGVLRSQMAAAVAEAAVPAKANGTGAGCCAAKGPGYATPRDAMEKGRPEGLLYVTCVYSDVRDGGEGDGVPG